MKPQRFKKSDWLNIGLQAVGEDGPPGLTIEALTQRTGKTTGSFYAHFASTEAFHAQLAEHWHQVFTRDLIDTVSRHSAPAARLDHLNRLAFKLDPKVEQGMRRLAAIEPKVAAICARVDAERIAYLASEYAASRQYTPPQARDLARIEYAAFVGLQSTEADATPEALAQLYDAFLSLTGRDTTKNPT